MFFSLDRPTTKYQIEKHFSNSKKTLNFTSKKKGEQKVVFSSLHLFFIAQSKSPQSGWQKNAKLSNDCATANPAQKHRIYI